MVVPLSIKAVGSLNPRITTRKKHIKLTAPAQAGAAENQNLFMTMLRESLRSAAEQMLLDEVSALCGSSHYPQPGATYRRAGTEVGV
jgi:hypothetical protein